MHTTHLNPSIFRQSSFKFNKAIVAIFFGISFCSAQILFTWIFAPKDPLPLSQYYRMNIPADWETQSSNNLFLNGYQRFNNWDSLRFFEIAQNGYHLPKETKIIGNPDVHQYRANITNLPTYPLLVRTLEKTFLILPHYALLLAAQLGCLIFWAYFWLYLFEKNFTQKEIVLAAITFGFAPGAFYLVCGYSESTLLATEMGLIYWTDHFLNLKLKKASSSTDVDDGNHFWKTISWIAIAAHGFFATFSRLPAIPLAIYPLLKLTPPSSREINEVKKTPYSKLSTRLCPYINCVILSALSACGLATFFIYCQMKFGRWDIYFVLSDLVGQVPNYLAIFNPTNYIPHFFYEDTQLSMNRAMAPWLVGFAGLTLKLDLAIKKRISLYLIALGLFYMTIAGKAAGGMDGMIRYSLPIYLPLVLCFATVMQELKISQLFPKKLPKHLKWVVIALSLLSLSCQAWSAYRYLHGRWVS